MKQVVYISWMPLSEKVERDWYIAYLREQGVSVAFWDVTALIFPGMSFQAPLDRDYLAIVTSYGQFAELIASKDTSRTNFVMFVNYEGRFNRLYRMLTSHGCRLFFFEWGNFPIKNRSRVRKYASQLRNPVKCLATVWYRCVGFAAINLNLVKPFDVVFAAGNASLAMHPKACRLVPVNLCDYDNYMQDNEKPRKLVSGRYCVFLDINLAFQSDIKVVGWDYVNPANYAASLNRFFRIIEERYGVEVVIAAHPKAEYDEKYFEGRQALKGVTPELVRNAEFIISHHSTAISYAVLNRKPLLFVYTEEMARIYRHTIVGWMGDFAEYLHQPIYNIDQLPKTQEVEVREPDQERYDLYKYNYLTTPESEHRLTRDIFFAEITA